MVLPFLIPNRENRSPLSYLFASIFLDTVNIYLSHPRFQFQFLRKISSPGLSLKVNLTKIEEIS
ncbi:hypothetical protein F2Q70_00022779 [Brassica cretica]|uniref:Uncharacterized protein n=1 Tax=Brassica cretica TaxID=69181 RepID=A0A8S9GNT3_BRACR|nr:hypothetical protein F2Q70_00022779 [Brassica cretica]